MPKNKFLIAPFNTGLQNNERPFLIPDDAFAVLKNAQIYRGKLIKRFGTRYCYGLTPSPGDQVESRLRVNLGTTDANGFFPAPATYFKVPGANSVLDNMGQMFSVEDTTNAVQHLTVNDNAAAGVLGRSGNPSGNYYTIAGAQPIGSVYISNAGANKIVYYYPSTPVMGFAYMIDGSYNSTFAFDTQFAYEWITGNWLRSGAEALPLLAAIAPDAQVYPSIWTSTDSNYFTYCMYKYDATPEYNIMIVSNNDGIDHLRYYTHSAIGAPVSQIARTWKEFRPSIGNLASPNTLYVRTARLMFQFHNQLVMVNIEEDSSPGNKVRYQGKARWSKPGNILDTTTDMFPANYYENAPVDEAALGGYILRDHLIIFFENSVWELVYTGNPSNYYVWKEINSKYGILSTTCLVPIDWNLVAISNKGIISCNGAQVQTIDSKIPDEVFNYSTGLPSFPRISGTIDFKTRNLYFTFPSNEETVNKPFLRNILTLNYDTGCWSKIDDTFTTFGSFYEGTNAPINEKYKRTIAGNQSGFITVLDYSINRNAGLLSIYDITFPGTVEIRIYIKDHCLSDNDYILIEDCVQSPLFPTSPTDNITSFNNKIFKVINADNSDFVIINRDPGETLNGHYGGKGVVSKITPIDIETKDFSFYIKEGRKSYISGNNLLIKRDSNGEITIDTYASTSYILLGAAGVASGCKIGTNKLSFKGYNAYENTQDIIWHKMYFNARGDSIKFKLYLTDDTYRASSQVRNVNKAHASFELNAMIIDAEPKNEF